MIVDDSIGCGKTIKKQSNDWDDGKIGADIIRREFIILISSQSLDITFTFLKHKLLIQINIKLQCQKPDESTFPPHLSQIKCGYFQKLIPTQYSFRCKSLVKTAKSVCLV